MSTTCLVVHLFDVFFRQPAEKSKATEIGICVVVSFHWHKNDTALKSEYC